MKNIFTLVSKICVVLFGILTALVFTAGSIMNTNAAAVSNFLNAKTQIVVEDEEAEDIDNVYYKTDYSSVEEERKNAEGGEQDKAEPGAKGIALVGFHSSVIPFHVRRNATYYAIFRNQGAGAQAIHAGTLCSFDKLILYYGTWICQIESFVL